MFEGGTRGTNVTTAVHDVEKQAFENLANAYDCSQAALNRMLIYRAHREVFGDLHPQAVPRNDVDVDALLTGDLEPDALPDELKMDGDEPAQIPAPDGGVTAAPTPSSYTPTYTPQDLADGGVELTWDELKESVGRYWSDDLEVHPDRVRKGGDVDVADDGTYDHDDYALRARQTTVAKILTGVLRSHGDVVDEKLVDAMILQYTSHQINRTNTSAGERYKKETYKEVLVDDLGYLIPHPDPLRDEYYTSETAAEELFAEEVEETIAELVDTTWALDPKQHAQKKTVNPRDDATEWLEDLAEFRQGLGFLEAITSDEAWSDRLEAMDDPVGELPNAKIAAAKTYNELLQQYVRVNQWARFAVGHAVLELEDDNVLTDEVSTGDDWKQVNADRPTQPLTEWVVHRDQPLSPQAQIAAVSEKL